MKAMIFTEGGKKFGFGHISRCTALYDAFVERGVDTKLSVMGDSSAENMLMGYDYAFTDWINDLAVLKTSIRDVDTVVIDSYHAPIDLYRIVSETVKTCIYLDDDMRIDYPKGFVINGAIGAEALSYLFRDEVHYLLGIDYFILRKPFINLNTQKRASSVQNILVTFGGNDMRNLVPDILEYLNTHYPAFNIKVIIGTGFDNISAIENISSEKTELIFFPQAESVRDLMVASDLAISACGQTLYELAACNVPIVGVGIAENQQGNIEGWKKHNNFFFAGWWNKNFLNNINDGIHHVKGKQSNIPTNGVQNIMEKTIS